ncbi:hypothetical protein BGW80DRAFT_1209075, partial [Lactifluus volemus]
MANSTDCDHDSSMGSDSSSTHLESSKLQDDSDPRLKELLAPLHESIIHKPPFLAGSLQLPPSHFSLVYKVGKDDYPTRHINFANAAPEELERLIQEFEPASVGCSKDEVMDEAQKTENESFFPFLVPDHTDLIKIVRNYLLEGTDSNRRIRVDLHEFNVNNKGSFFKAHVDAPRGENEKMFGSLVVVFPTSHEGGTLVIRHRGQEWSFDSSTALSAALPTSIAYAAFFCDVEHEVQPVTSGHRVTLTYNLYFDEDERVSAKDLVSGFPSFPQELEENVFRSRFEALLKNPEFLPDGGTLGFGMRHKY